MNVRPILSLIAALMLALFSAQAHAADLTVDKSSAPVADQVSTGTPARNLPGATIDYSLNVTNPALNPVVIKKVVIVDIIPTTVKFRIVAYGSAAGPVEFTNGNLLTIPLLASGLTYSGIEYYDGISWTYVPHDDGTGYDGNIRSIRVTMSNGTMTTGGSFRLRYRVVLK